MIDLGVELANYGEDEPRRPGIRMRDGGLLVPLSDLQAQGFNRTPPWYGSGGGGSGSVAPPGFIIGGGGSSLSDWRIDDGS